MSRIDRNAQPSRLSASDHARLSNAATSADRPRLTIGRIWVAVPPIVKLIAGGVLAAAAVENILPFFGV